MCVAVKRISQWAKKKWRDWRRNVITWSLLERVCRIFTTAMLSHLHKTCFLDQRFPYVAMAITIGSISLVAMENFDQEEGHCRWNQWGGSVAPQPQDPEASVKKVWLGRVYVWCCKHDTLFQTSRKRCHHLRSDLKSELRRM